jgi:hypothetical protein
MDMPMSLQDYIDKYGEESGTKRYNGVQKLLVSRKKTYDSQPYARFTKEWFVWKYPKDGLDKFNEHVNKSRQSEENMIKRWGEELGKKKWQETVAKKNTVALTREKFGDEVVADRYKRQQETASKQSPEQKEDIKRRRNAGLEKHLSENVRGKTRLEFFTSRYGEIEGTQRYHETMKKAFHGPNRMSAPAKQVYTTLCEKLPQSKIDELYCDVPGKQEFWLSESPNIYGYDFTHRETKSILEFNGSFWHPEEPNESLHPVTKKTLTEMYNNDKRKKELAEENGFTVFVITDKMTSGEQELIVDQFCANITKGL